MNNQQQPRFPMNQMQQFPMQQALNLQPMPQMLQMPQFPQFPIQNIPRKRKYHQLTEYEKTRIFYLKGTGKNISEIANELHLSRTSINYYIKRVSNNPSITYGKTGRPRKKPINTDNSKTITAIDKNSRPNNDFYIDHQSFPFNKQPQTSLPPNAVPPQLPNAYFNQVNQYRMNPPPDSNNPNNLKQHPEIRQGFET